MKLISGARALKHKLFDLPQRRAVEAILSKPDAPDTLAAERDFDALQAKYPPLPEYGYDGISLMRRAAQRMAEILANIPPDDRKLRFLDVGAGDGTLGALFASGGHDATLCDLRDWRKPLAAGLTFVEGDCCSGLPLPSDSFDIITSFNAFEHMADPGAALAELVRLTAPGGLIHLDFNPLYGSPWGLHAHRTLRMPYPQFLFSRAFVEDKLRKLGISDLGEDRTELQFVNGWRTDQYEQIWHRHSQMDCVEVSSHVDTHLIGLVKRYPASFSGRDLRYIDMVTAGLRVVLRKRVDGANAAKFSGSGFGNTAPT